MTGKKKRAQVEDPEGEGSACSTDCSPTSSKLFSVTEKHNKAQQALKEGEEMEFEDPYGDEIEEESVVSDEEQSEIGEGESDGEEDSEMEAEVEVKPWIPGVDSIKEGEQLEYDPSSYAMLHRCAIDWSCLSFDIFPDTLGANRSEYPHTAYVVAGTQADKEKNNRVYIMKWSNLHETRKDGKGDDSDDESDEEESEEEADLDFRVFAHPGTVNRIRVCPQIPRCVGIN
eukprot:GHVQ01031859.1.p3 GENE.GHVQ01031859.1~~GHVQ01031859.1.p3  ORF type:complete len:229 (+),score=55.02 GHVQ01031859.1:3314-4000(+)